MVEISLRREEWLGPLQSITSIVEKRHARPILSHILLQGQRNQLMFVGSDAEMELHSVISVEQNYDDLCITIPGKKFLDICRSVAENSVIKLTENAGRVNLQCVHSRFTMPSFPPAEFPLMMEQKMEIELKLLQEDLAALIDKTSFAIPQQDVRRYLNGLLFEVKDGKLMALATDGHRLAMHKVDCVASDSIFAQVIIPKKAIFALTKLFGATDREVTLGFNSNYVRVESEEGFLISKLISGKFPNYGRIVPPRGELSVVINCGELRQALARVNILSSELFRSVHFSIRKNMLTLDANNPEQEEAVEELMVDYQGPEVAMVFNISYFIDILNTIEISQGVRIFFNEAGGNVVLEEEDCSADCFYVLMPIRQ